MATASLPLPSLRTLAAITVAVSALCRLTEATYPTCNAGFDWAFNGLNESPCEVSAALGGVCIGGANFSLATLTSSTEVYAGPSAGFGTPCRCNTVYYSTLSACALCQGAGYNIWSYYATNCTAVYAQLFPSPIPSGISVPHWAYLDVTAANTFDPTLAQNAGGSDSSAIPQATGSTRPSSSTKKTNVGAIAGGVAGGLVGLALVIGILFWLLRRKRNAASTSAPGTFDPQLFASYEKPPITTTNTGNASNYTSAPTSKLYDPNDPTTFPGYIPQHYTGSTNNYAHSPPAAPPQPLYPVQPNFSGSGGNTQYTGAPEL